MRANAKIHMLCKIEDEVCFFLLPPPEAKWVGWLLCLLSARMPPAPHRTLLRHWQYAKPWVGWVNTLQSKRDSKRILAPGMTRRMLPCKPGMSLSENEMRVGLGVEGRILNDR